MASRTWLRFEANLIQALTPAEWEPDALARLVDVPLVAVLSFGPGVGFLVSERLRRDLNATWAVSARGHEDTAPTTHDTRDVDYLVTGALHDGSRVVAELWKRGVEGDELMTVIERAGADFNDLTATIALAICQRLQRPPAPNTDSRHAGARFTAAAWQRAVSGADNETLLADEVCRARLPPQALGWLEDVPHQVATAASIIDPFDAQLAFGVYCARPIDRPEAARALIAALRHAPTHGKAQMCLAHVFPRHPWLGSRVLAHARAGLRLLPNNSFAMTNLEGYLEQFEPDDPQRIELVEDAIALDPLSIHPWMSAVDFYRKRGDARRALRAARQFYQLLTAEPVHPRTLEALRSLPGLEDLAKARTHATKWLRICEQEAKR
jgi:hypothetical protein